MSEFRKLSKPSTWKPRRRPVQQPRQKARHRRRQGPCCSHPPTRVDGCLARVGRPSILSRPAIANRLDHHGESNDQLGMAAARTETQKPLPRGTGARPSAGIKFAEMLLALPLDSRPHFAAIDVGNRSRPIVMADVSEI